MAGQKLNQVKDKLKDAGKLTGQLSKQGLTKAGEVTGKVAEKIGDAYEYSVISKILAEPVKAMTAEQTKLLKGFRREIEFKGVVSEEYFENAKETFAIKLAEIANESVADIPDKLRNKKVLASYTFDESMLSEIEQLDISNVKFADNVKVVEANTDKLKVVAKDSAVQVANKYGTKAIATITKRLGAKGASKAIGNIPFVGIALSFAVDEAVERGDKFVKLRNESLAFYKATGLQEYFTDMLTQTAVVISEFKESLEESGEKVDQLALDNRIEESLDD
ncbi:hypothetical protein QFK56_08115 [Weissella cibaria]|uniref:hypothetical protein n=1 Tax=Weissella cibaria TaxID=137591 RepID=UPI002458B6D5|nr:hypothetical protein [Weissella cibaria]MDH5013102.1 hypothetical protein [Weissella cibaria]